MAIPLAVAAVAYACTSVATISANPATAAAGSTLTITGKYFGVHGSVASADNNGPAVIRFGSMDGPVLATASPSGTDRSFSVAVTIPKNAAVGQTILIATQNGPDGTPVYGTPARQLLSVTAANNKAALANAIAACKRKFSHKSQKRAACIGKAARQFSPAPDVF
jgi:hypothetical protein